MRRWLPRVMVLLAVVGLTGWNLSRSSKLEAASRAYRQGRYAPALQASLDHLSRRPWSREASRIAGLCLSKLDFASQAEPYYARAGMLTEEEAHVRAYGILRSNQRLEAEAAYKEILARSPNDPEALRLLAGLYMTMMRYAEGAELAETLAQLPGQEIVGTTMVGTLRHRQGEVQRAIEAYEQVLRLDPDLSDILLPREVFWVNYAQDLLTVGRTAEAAEKAEAYLATDPENATMLELLGRARQALGQLDRAEEAWRRALHADAGRAELWNHLGRLELMRGNLEEARRLLERSVELDPESYTSVYNLLLTNRRLGRQDEVERLQKRLDAIKAKSGTPTQRMGSP